MYKFLLSFGLIILVSTGLFSDVTAQKRLHGHVIDATTGETLPAANLHLEGTYQGTITNVDGAYQLVVPQLPATLVVRYIGYETVRLSVTVSSPEQQDIRLKPVTYEMEEIVVTDEDPAIQIMRQVIARKKVWRADLKTYETEAYNRFTMANDTGIVTILETLTQTYWHHDQGLKEVMKARRTTSNLNLEEAMPAALFVSNLYDDDIEVGGFKLMGVTHPNALDHYTFRLKGTRYLDDQLVYDITAEPKSGLAAGFVGQVTVLSGAYALLEVALRPSKAFLFPPPVERYEVTFYQQFSNFGQAFWLPVDFRSQTQFKVGMGGILSFPTVHVDQVSRFTNYRMNLPVPDSLYQQKKNVVVDSSAVANNEELLGGGNTVPLSALEQRAYARIDSTMDIGKAFTPTGLLAKYAKTSISVNDESVTASSGDKDGFFSNMDVDPAVWYNRVDEAHLGLDLTARAGQSLKFKGGLGGSTGLEKSKRWSYHGSLRFERERANTFFFELGYKTGSALRYESKYQPRLFNTAYTLLGGGDYFDYYYSEGLQSTLGYRIDRLETTLSATYRAERHASLTKNTDYDLVGRSKPLRDNPAIQPGTLRTLGATLAVGDDFTLVGLTGQRRLALSVEYTPASILRNDVTFTRAALDADWRLPTFFRRRLLPNTLDLHLTAGTFWGNLPPQRFGIVDGTLGIHSPFGSLRTLEGRPYEGDRYAAVFWEHNFRTVPFEVVGLRGLAQKSYNLILFGGHARTSVTDKNRASLAFAPYTSEGWHHEVGVSLSGILSILRLDAAIRLDRPGFGVGISTARIF